MLLCSCGVVLVLLKLTNFLVLHSCPPLSYDLGPCSTPHAAKHSSSISRRATS
jgi:hypothetical protein